MNECTHSRRIEVAAVRGVALEDFDRTHLADCAECRGLVAAIHALANEGRAAERAAAARLPSTAAILAAAGSARPRPAARRALWPIIWLEWATAVLSMLALAAALWWALRRGTGSWDAALDSALEGGGAEDVFSVSMLIAALAMLAAVVWGLGGFEDTRPHRR